MSSIESIKTPQDYVNYTFNLTSRGITEVTSELTGMSSTVSNLIGLMAFKTSEYLTHTETLMVSLGYAAATTFTTATQQAIRFQQALADVKAIGGESVNAIEIGQAAMKYSNQFGMNVDAMTEGLEALSRAGLTATNVMSGVLEEGVKLSKLEGMDLEESINSLISTTNLLAVDDYDVNSKEYAEAVKQMNQHIVSTSESAPINAHNIIQSLQHVGGYASANSIDQDDLFAVIAQLGSKGTKGEMAGTALRAFIAAGQKDKAQRTLARVGLDVSDLWTENGDVMLPISEMKSVLDEALEARGYSKQEKLEFYSDFAGYKQANQIMKIDVEEVQQYKSSIAQAWDLGRKLEEILGTVHSNIQIIAQTTKNFLTRVGQTALPYINAILQPIKWTIQLIDKIPFSENIVGIGLAFLSFKGALLLINRVVPAVASLYSRFKGAEKHADNIRGSFHNLLNDVKQAKEIIQNWDNPSALARIRLHNDVFGANNEMYRVYKASLIYKQVGMENILGKENFYELDPYLRNIFMDAITTLEPNSDTSQKIDDVIYNTYDQVLTYLDSLNTNQTQANPFIYKEDTVQSNQDKNSNVQIKKAGVKEVSDSIKKNTESNYKIINDTKSRIDELNNYIKSHTDKSTDQYDIGKGIMSVAKPLGDIIADSIFNRFNSGNYKTNVGNINFNKNVGADASKELDNIFETVRKNINDLPDISFAYDNDIEKMVNKTKSLKKEIAIMAKDFSNIDVRNMSPNQARRALKSIDVKAMGRIGINYSEMMNEAYIREILNQNNFDKNNKFIERIYDEQVNKLAESLDVDVSRVKNKVEALEKIYDTFHKESNKKSIDDVVASSTEWYHNKLNKRTTPSETSTKWLSNSDSEYIMKRMGISYDASNKNFTKQLQNRIGDKDIDMQTRWMVQEIAFAIQKEKSQGVYSDPESAELKYMVEHVEALNQSIMRLKNEINPMLSLSLDEDGSFRGWKPSINLPFSKFKGNYGAPSIDNQDELVYSFLTDMPIVIDNKLPVGGMAGSEAVTLNPLYDYHPKYGLEGQHTVDQFFMTYIHEMTHELLQHNQRGGLTERLGINSPYNITDKPNNPVMEAEVNSVVTKVMDYLGLNKLAEQTEGYRIAWTRHAQKYGVENEINKDMIESTAHAIERNITPIFMRFVDIVTNKNSPEFAPVLSDHDTKIYPSVYSEGTQNLINRTQVSNSLRNAFLYDIQNEKVNALEDEITALEDEIITLKRDNPHSPLIQQNEKKIAQLQNQIAEINVKDADAHNLIPDNNFFDVVVTLLNAINDNIVAAAKSILTKKPSSNFKTFTEDAINLHARDKKIEEIKENALHSEAGVGTSSYLDYQNQMQQINQEISQNNIRQQQEEERRQYEQHKKDLRKIINEPNLSVPTSYPISTETINAFQTQLQEQQQRKKLAQEELDAILKKEARRNAKGTQSIIDEGNKKYFEEYGDRVLKEAQSTHGISQGFKASPKIPTTFISSEERSYLAMQGSRDAYINYLSYNQSKFKPRMSASEATDLYELIGKVKKETQEIANAYLDWYEEIRYVDTAVTYVYGMSQDVTESLQETVAGFYGFSEQYQAYLLEEEKKANEALKEQQRILNDIPSISYAGNPEYSRKVSGLYDEQVDLSGPVYPEQGKKDIDAANAYINPPGLTQNEIAQQWLKSIEANTQAIEAQTELLNVAKNISTQAEEEADYKKAKSVLEEIIPVSKTSPVFTSYGMSGYSQIPTEEIRRRTIIAHNEQVQKDIEKMRPIFKEHTAPSVKEVGEVDERGRSKYVSNLVAERNQEVQDSIEKMRPLFKQWREEANQAWEETLEKIKQLKIIANNMEFAPLKKEVEETLKELEKIAKYREALNGKYNGSSQMIDEEKLQEFLTITTIPNMQAIINQQQQQIRQQQDQETVAKFTTSTQETYVPEDIEVSPIGASSPPEKPQNTNRRNLNQLKERIRSSANRVIYEEQKELVDWSIKQIENIKYTIGATIADTEEEYTYKQAKANEAANQVRKSLDEQQKAENELNEAKRIEAEKITNNIKRQNSQVYARMKRSEKRAKRLQDEAQQLEEDNKKALEAETEHMKRIGEQQKQMLSDFTDALGFLLTVGEEINRKNIQDISSLPVTNEDWDQVDNITEEDYRASRRAANRMRQNAKNRKTPEELEQERIDKDWIENKGANLTPEEFNKKLEEEENSFSRKELTDMKAEIRKNSQDAKQKREQYEKEKEEKRINTARENLINNQKAREAEQERINNALSTGKGIITPEEEERLKDNPDERSKYITQDEFNKIIEEEESWAPYTEKMIETISSINSGLLSMLEEQKRANDLAEERNKKIESADDAANQTKRLIEQGQQKQRELVTQDNIEANQYYGRNRRQEREDFWNDIEKEENDFLEALQTANQIAPQMLETMKHQLGRSTTPLEDILNDKMTQKIIKDMADGVYNQHISISDNDEMSDEEKERIRQLHIQGVGVNPEYEGLSFIDIEKMKLDHKYGKEYLNTFDEDGHLTGLKVKREQSFGERIARWGLGVRAKINELPDKIPDKSTEAAQLREQLSGTKEKITNIIGPMESFNDGLQRAAEIFPPLMGVARGFNTALEFMYGIESALGFVQTLLNSEKFTEMLVNAGLMTSETAVNIAKGTETATTIALTGAIGALEAIISGPLLIVIGVIIAAIAALYISEKSHADAIKKNQEALEASDKSMKSALAAYKSIRQARISETDATRKHNLALKESIALKKVENERSKKLYDIQQKAVLENDPIWGESHSLRTDTQTGAGVAFLGGILPGIIAKVMAGEYENIADKHAENTYQTRSIVDSNNIYGGWGLKLDNMLMGYDTQYASKVDYFYRTHSREFAEMDAFAPQLEKLYDIETQAQKIYGKEGARDSVMFKNALQEVADETGLSGDRLGSFLDYMQVEANVEAARTNAQNEFGDIISNVQREVNKILYPNQDYMGNLNDEQNNMVLAMIEDEARKAKEQMFQNAVLEYMAAITALMQFDGENAKRHAQAGNTWLANIHQIDENKQRIAEKSLEIAESEKNRKDYGVSAYSLWGDTPFGGAVESANSIGLYVPNATHGASETIIEPKNDLQKNSGETQLSKDKITSEKLTNNYSSQQNNNGASSGIFDTISNALDFATNFTTGIIGSAISNFFSDESSDNTTPLNDSMEVSKNIIQIDTININTEDDPEKIKSVFMNLMIEMQEQVIPRQVSRTIGASKNQNNQIQAEGVDILSNNINNNNTNNNNTT